MNYTRTIAVTLRSGDTIVMFDELTGDPRTVQLRTKKTYEGTGSYFEFHTGEGLRLGFSPDTEVMRCDP